MLLVAPHGGRRRNRALRGRDGGRLKINDLGTADLAAALAERLDASLLANVALDRNVLDLNRISAVEREAPWFLEELATLVGGILERHERAEILVVHGWHVVQAKCDVGVGARLEGEADGSVATDRLTVSASYLRERLGAFRARAGERVIDVAFGERYPASHPENLLQLFRREAAERRGPRVIAEAAAAGRTEAVQLELGVPLRFPGKLRDAFVEVMAEVFGGEASSPALLVERRGRGSATRAVPSGRGLRVHDPALGLALVAGVSPNPDGSLGGRLLLIDGDEVVLFTGEERGRSELAVGGLAIETRPDGFDVRFEGPAIGVDDGDLYLRTEAALDRARLVEVRLEVAFRRGATDVYGRVRGEAVLDGRARTIDAAGFADASFARGVGRGERRHVAFAAAFGPALGLTIRCDGGDGGPRVERHDEDGPTALDAALEELVARRRFERARLRFADGARLSVEPESRISILRPIGGRAFARISFGAARFALDGEGEGSGFYEYAEAWP